MSGLILSFIGAIAAVIGSYGLVRFPDVYTRAHAQTVINVSGACLMIIGFILTVLGDPVMWRLLILIILIFLTSPTATHAISKAAYKKHKSRKK